MKKENITLIILWIAILLNVGGFIYWLGYNRGFYKVLEIAIDIVTGK